jgi:hypothetical protein
MVRLAKDRIRKLEEVRCDLEFIETDFREYNPVHQFDCVVTHFFLDLFSPPTQGSVIKRIAEFTSTSGAWINVDFLPGRELRDHILMSLQYAFFRVVSRIEAKRCFDESAAAAACGWTVGEAISYLGGLVAAKRYLKRSVPATRRDTPSLGQ